MPSSYLVTAVMVFAECQVEVNVNFTERTKRQATIIHRFTTLHLTFIVNEALNTFIIYNASPIFYNQRR